MSKRIFYNYNPETDNFERFYPTARQRLGSMAKILILALVISVIFILIYNYVFALPTEKNLQKENSRLQSEYKILNKRMENLLTVLDRISERDDNLYRVMLQMDPVSDAQRLSGLGNESRYKSLSRMGDADLVDELNQRMNLLEQRMVSQIQSFDQLKTALENQQDKLSHIPAILPINISDYTMSSGYGWRNDPVTSIQKFHAGLDFAAPQGTEVYATADGKVTLAGHKTGYGNTIDIDHGYNYLTRYAHLSEILVKDGENVKRGKLIGKVGSSGKSTGPHLHYEVRYKDEPQNPVNFYFLDISPEQYYEMVRRAEDAGHVMD